MSDTVWVGTWRPHHPRRPIMAQFTSPGPKYSVQGTTGYMKHNPTKWKAPAYSLSGVKSLLGDNCSPVIKTSNPSYSMTWKNKLGRFDEDLHKISLTKSRAPTATFGIRHSEYITPLILDA
uniref:Ciliary microtubule associated protein 1A n=1 Tax=Sphenodon punctatus TaxID=8508 RepID=A0A8D0GF55_SPHPU